MDKKRTQQPTRAFERYKRFAQEYVVDLNETQAAIRAGYSPKTAHAQASRLLKNVKVREYVKDAISSRSKRTEITQDRVLQEYAKIAFTDLPGIVNFDGRSMSVEDFEKLTPAQRACIKKIKVKLEMQLQPDGEKTPVDTVEVELHSKQSALDSIAKHLGMFPATSKIELTGKDGADLIPVYAGVMILPEKDPKPK